jgi:hypothetical protein
VRISLASRSSRSMRPMTTSSTKHAKSGNRAARDLCDDDATQIIENVVGFFSILAEWSISETAAPANDRGESDSSGDEGASHAC